MHPTHAASLTPRELVEQFWSRRRLWLATTAACGSVALAYALVMPRFWEASLGLVVRQETAGSAGARPGKFADLYEMRTLQETILELAKSQQVVVATIDAVNRRDGVDASTTPSLEDVEEFRSRLKMLPPKGGEFGKTEVFYFCVRDASRARAINLVTELCAQLDGALKRLRSVRAESLIAELDEQRALAAELLDKETQSLAEFETRAGADLGELRMLHSANAGQSDLRMEAVQLEADARRFRTQVREAEKLLELIEAAQDDPRQLVATPNSLLTSQPALRRLKDGLVDAQLATSRLGGTRLPDHPRVRAAQEAELQIRDDLHRELVTAIRGAEVELQLCRDRLSAAEQRLGDIHQRLGRLAELRAEYSNRVAAADNCRQTLDRARQDLSTAKAAQAAAHSGSLVTRLDEAETGPHPAGPSRAAVAAAGAMAGLMLGLGLTFLIDAPRRQENPPAAAADVNRADAATEANKVSSQSPTNASSPSSAAEWWELPGGPVESVVSANGHGAAATTKRAEGQQTLRAVPAPTFTAPAPSYRPVSNELAGSAAAQRVVAKSASRAAEEGSESATRGSLPPLASLEGFGGMSLQEALQAAEQLAIA